MNKDAYSQFEILLFLRGENANGFSCVFANLPTDPLKVIGFFKDDIITNPSFRNELINSVVILSNDFMFSWFTLYYLFAIIRINKTNNLGIGIEDLIAEIDINLKKYEDELKTLKIWIGLDSKNGVWGDVERMSNNIFEEFGYRVYPCNK